MSGMLPPQHQAFVERVRAGVSRDPRLKALLAGGSYVHGGFDRYSDLDFVVVVESGGSSEVMATRRQFAESLGDLLSAFSGEHVGEPRLLICLYGPPLLHVDLKFIVAEDLGRLVERPAVLFARDAADIEARLDAAVIHWPERSPEWFEQRAWIWLHYGAAKLGRGELFEAMGMLAFFRDQVLGPMLHRRAGRAQRGIRRMEISDSAASELLVRTAATHDADSIRDALSAAAGIYLDLRDDEPPRETVVHMPGALLEFLESTVVRT
ncbi:MULTISPECIES: nucleotidyltransferase domain-containing protein [unclassified Pseudoxanthomonas]|uniref:nucleotidyltransferase domain-containing protein n=1 Tax=unclassified Pseudoxanthomonas TaxID=2645906 RepID=UPI00161C1BFB|nr:MULTISPECIES: nucleotidyltransferase domain-containing protein [unclassified Pseudoxanthomonas]MBB3276894.1 hypothetical protein [Pseudoxanthomonas sp. OG2]MBV7475814.1 nucleotidyltransferase domain-containing protein [Pseudoxanthomonas sp. PXM05]